MIRLYDYWESGNCYKVRLMLSQLDIDFERVDLDILEGATRSDAYLAKNPNHRVPLVEWPDGKRLAESNAILFHLSQGTHLLPEDDFDRALALQWMCFEQYSHEPYIAVVRFWHFSGAIDDHRDELASRMESGYGALQVMESHLAQRPFFVGEQYSIADIALYAYTHVAAEGDFELERFPHIRTWLERVAGQPDHVSIEDKVGFPVSWP